MMELVDQDLMSMFKDIKENMNIMWRKMEIQKRNKQNFMLKNSVSEMNIFLDGIKSRLESSGKKLLNMKTQQQRSPERKIRKS